MAVAVYIRWSTEDQGEGTTLAVQQEACRHFVLSQGWPWRADLVFVDDGYSGATLERPALNALRKRVAAGEVDCVVCYRLDRLSRSVVDTINLVLQEWDGRCHVKSAREPIDTATQAGRMFFYTLVSYAEWERATIAQRTSAGRLRRATEGRWAAGRPPYGYTVDAERRLVLHPEEAPVVARIFREYLSGRGSAAIAFGLVQEGLAFRGRTWRTGAVKRVLENPVYCGELRYGSNRVNPHHGRRTGEPRLLRAPEPQVRLPGAVPAVITVAEFEAAQSRRQERSPRGARGRGGRAYSSPHLLSALARCARCGASLVAHTKGAGGKGAVYCCRGAREMGPAVCDSGMIGAVQLEAVVVSKVKELYGSAVERERFLGRLAAEAAAQAEQVRGAREAAVRVVARLEGERSRLRRLLRSGELQVAEYRDLLAEVSEELRMATARAAEAERLESALAAEQGSQGALRALLAVMDTFEALPVAQQKELLRQLVDRLEVFKPKGSGEIVLEIAWRVPAVPVDA